MSIRGSNLSFQAPIWLASRSPRRALMLREAGIDFHIAPADIDDAALSAGQGATPAGWVMALAYLKARRVADALRARGEAGTVLGADTVCVADTGEIMGQPRDAAAARNMLTLLRHREHSTMTGVALLSMAPIIASPAAPSPAEAAISLLQPFRRLIFIDIARVRIGNVPDHAIEAYIASGDWRGKAGAYNLSERIAAGWPIECTGDPATVMGLPMQRLIPILRA